MYNDCELLHTYTQDLFSVRLSNDVYFKLDSKCESQIRNKTHLISKLLLFQQRSFSRSAVDILITYSVILLRSAVLFIEHSVILVRIYNGRLRRILEVITTGVYRLFSGDIVVEGIPNNFFNLS